MIDLGTGDGRAVMARAREISIMRLVGATDAFIRRPFLIDGFLKGILGGLLALSLTWFASQVISHNFIQTAFFSRSLASLGLLGGAMIGVLGSSLSVGRHLRKV